MGSSYFQSLEKEIYNTCATYGNIEKITICSKHIDGIVIIKFTQPHAASNVLNDINNKQIFFNNNNKNIIGLYWDGVTDYTTNSSVENYEKEKKKEEERLDEFGNWLEN